MKHGTVAPAALTSALLLVLQSAAPAFAWVQSTTTSDVIQEASSYSITDLGVLGSDENAYSLAYGINAAGDVAGQSTSRGAFWRNGILTDLGVLTDEESGYSSAQAVNDAGLVVGYSLSATGQEHAFLWQDGSMTDLGTLGSSAPSLATSQAWGINSLGHVVGGASTSENGRRAFLYRDGGMTDLGPLDENLPGGTEAFGINDADQVVGVSFSVNGLTGFLWQNGAMTSLGTEVDAPDNLEWAMDINNGGQVIGSGGDFGSRALLWEDGTVTDLGVIGPDDFGNEFALPLSINDQGQIVGYSSAPDAPSGQHAFLWQDGEMIDLNTRVPEDSGWDLEEASGINEAGQIVGVGSVNGQTRAFLLTPGGANVNQPPSAGDDTLTTAEDSAAPVTVLSNDTDPNGDALSVLEFSQPTHGAVASGTGGTLVYTPNANFHGQDAFSYTVSDGNGGTDTASVAVTVTPVNDAPQAAPDTSAATSAVPATITVLYNDLDADGDTMVVTAVTQPANGTATISPDGATVTYTSVKNFTGTNSFSYTVSDGNGGTATSTVTLTVSKPNSPPRARNDNVDTDPGVAVSIPVLANDTDPDGDPLVLLAVEQPGAGEGTVTWSAGNTVTYTPPAGFRGRITFTYTVGDGRGGTDTARVAVRVR